jgi:hypothetical protein
MTPFKLLFREKARLPSFPNEDIQKIHYGETTAAERFNLLQKLRKIAHENASSNGQKTKEQYDKGSPSYIYSKTSFLVQIKFITNEEHQTHIIILILN